MNITSERIPDSQVIVHVEIPWAEFDGFEEQVYKKLVKTVEVPGFRRGKAPRKILERRVGKEALKTEAIELAVKEAYDRSVEQENLEPISEPELNFVTAAKNDEGSEEGAEDKATDAAAEDELPPLTDGQPIAFTLTMAVRPDVALGDYKAIHFDRQNVDVTDTELDEAIERLRDQYFDVQDVTDDRGLSEGDIAFVDLKIEQDGDVISERLNQMITADAKSTPYGPLLVEYAIGQKVGETRNVTAPYPPGTDEEAAEYTLKLQSIKVRQKRALDDEFAKAVGNYESVEAMKKAFRESIGKGKVEAEDGRLEEAITTSVLDQSEVTIPRVLIDRDVDMMVDDLAASAKANRLSLPDYFRISGSTEEAFRTESEPTAKKRIKRTLVLDAIVKAEGIDVSDAEVAAELATAAPDERLDAEDEETVDAVKRLLRRRAAVKWLIASATGELPKKSEPEVSPVIAGATTSSETEPEATA